MTSLLCYPAKLGRLTHGKRGEGIVFYPMCPFNRDHLLRVVLNYKGIPYRTEWVEFPDIEPLSKKLGIEPTDHNSDDGSPLYTLPAIHDPSTGVYIADSTAIAEYLEKTYPNTPSVFPNETIGLQKAFDATFERSLDAVMPFILPVTNSKLNPASEEYFRRRLEDVPTGNARTEEWGKFEKGLASVHSYLALTDKKGPYILGDTISWSDLVLFSFLYWFKLVWGENSKEWKDIASWNGGRWEAHIDALKKYHTVL
jgi:glutathione S-transferase